MRVLPQLDAHPLADPRAVVAGGTWRITVLDAGLVRLEHAEDGVFEDRPSTFALHRAQPVPDFRVVESDAGVQVVTERFALTYDRGPFSTSGLSLEVRGGVSTWHSTWRYGLVEAVRAFSARDGNLGGTARTLDEADGAVPLEPGILSRNGYGVVDDSRSAVFEPDGTFAARRPAAAGERQDLYVFAYGRDYARALRAFAAVSGPVPLLPRWALGNWWSRYHPYTDVEHGELMDRFAAERLPFSVAVLDMDWHLVDVPARFGSGWTGYTWNRELIADPAAFVADLHARGLRVTLNDHPADGVRAFEDAYPAMAAAMGLSGTEQADEVPVAFDATDPSFLEHWLDLVRRPVERDGVDFWWMDWQQGPHSRVAGVDPLWVLNHVGYLDNRTDPSGRPRRPLGFSRYAGPGSHRYPVGFSGDALITWASLAFQPEFTAAAANIGYGWWSHDVGGHMLGARDDELAARWVQLGVFSPITRLHSSDSPFTGKEPWHFGPAARAAMGEALRLRHRLVPYLHTMNHRAATEGVSLVTPMYHAHPWREEAYAARTQFAFGSQLLVAPITAPADPQTLTGRTTAWLPPGTWVDVLSGLVYDGDREVVVHRGLGSLPVFAGAGALVPLDGADELGNDPVNPAALELWVVVGADGAFTLVEDDGTGDGSDPARCARTPITFDQARGELVVGPLTGPTDGVPERRRWTVTLLAHEARSSHLAATVDGAPAATGVVTGPRRTSVTVDRVPVGAQLRVQLGPHPQLAVNDTGDRLLALLDAAQVAFTLKERVAAVCAAELPLSVRLSALQALELPRTLETAVSELLLARP